MTAEQEAIARLRYKASGLAPGGVNEQHANDLRILLDREKRLTETLEGGITVAEQMVIFGQQFEGVSYGPFWGGDPREYTPDEDACSSDEVAAWKAACAEWDAGNEVDIEPGCLTLGDGSVYNGRGLGVGTHRLPPNEEAEVARKWLAKAREALEGKQ